MKAGAAAKEAGGWPNMPKGFSEILSIGSGYLGP